MLETPRRLTAGTWKWWFGRWVSELPGGPYSQVNQPLIFWGVNGLIKWATSVMTLLIGGPKTSPLYNWLELCGPKLVSLCLMEVEVPVDFGGLDHPPKTVAPKLKETETEIFMTPHSRKWWLWKNQVIWSLLWWGCLTQTDCKSMCAGV